MERGDSEGEHSKRDCIESSKIKEYPVDLKDTVFKELCSKGVSTCKHPLVIPKEQYVLLRFQTVTGHAQQGHGVFAAAKRKYPLATIGDIVLGAGLDPAYMKGERQRLVDEFTDCVERLIKGTTNRLENRCGDPVLGVEFFKGEDLVVEYALKAIGICGLMDSSEWREKTLKEFGYKNIEWWRSVCPNFLHISSQERQDILKKHSSETNPRYSLKIGYGEL